MTRLILHADDLPDWALREYPLPSSYLDHLSDPVHPSPDGKGLISDEEIMLRQQFRAAINMKPKAAKSSRSALKWLLNRIIKDNGAELAASKKRRTVVIDGVPYFAPLAPVLEILGCISVNEPNGADQDALRTIQLAPWFQREIECHCRPDKIEPVTNWLRDGGRQKPRIRDRDRHD